MVLFILRNFLWCNKQLKNAFSVNYMVFKGSYQVRYSKVLARSISLWGFCLLHSKIHPWNYRIIKKQTKYFTDCIQKIVRYRYELEDQYVAPDPINKLICGKITFFSICYRRGTFEKVFLDKLYCGLFIMRAIHKSSS